MLSPPPVRIPKVNPGEVKLPLNAKSTPRVIKLFTISRLLSKKGLAIISFVSLIYNFSYQVIYVFETCRDSQKEKYKSKPIRSPQLFVNVQTDKKTTEDSNAEGNAYTR